MSKRVRGRVIQEFYDNGKLVERSVIDNAVLNANYWRSWQKFDRKNAFGTTYLKTTFNYPHGVELMDYYSAKNERLNQKIVYRRDFKDKPRLK